MMSGNHMIKQGVKIVNKRKVMIGETFKVVNGMILDFAYRETMLLFPVKPQARAIKLFLLDTPRFCCGVVHSICQT